MNIAFQVLKVTVASTVAVLAVNVALNGAHKLSTLLPKPSA